MKLTAETLDNYISLSLEEKMKQFAVIPMTKLEQINDDLTKRLERIEKNQEAANQIVQNSPLGDDASAQVQDTQTPDSEIQIDEQEDSKSEVKAVSSQNKVLAKLTNGITSTGKYMKGMTSKITKSFSNSLQSGIKNIMSEGAFGPKEMMIFLMLVGLVKAVDKFVPDIKSSLEDGELRGIVDDLKGRLGRLGDVLGPLMTKIETYFGAIKQTMDAVFGPINRLLSNSYFTSLIKDKFGIPDYWGQNQAGSLMKFEGTDGKMHNYQRRQLTANMWVRGGADIVDSAPDASLVFLDKLPGQLADAIRVINASPANRQIAYWALGKELDPNNIDDIRIYAAATGDDQLVHWARGLATTQNKQLQQWYKDKGGKGIDVRPYVDAFSKDIDPNLLTVNPYDVNGGDDERDRYFAWSAAHSTEAGSERVRRQAMQKYAAEYAESHWDEIVAANSHPGQYQDAQGNWVPLTDENGNGRIDLTEGLKYQAWAGKNEWLGVPQYSPESVSVFNPTGLGHAQNSINYYINQYYTEKSRSGNPVQN